MSVFHRFGPYGPVCGARDGCNAADFEPPEVTCKRCKKIPSNYWDEHKTYILGGRILVSPTWDLPEGARGYVR